MVKNPLANAGKWGAVGQVSLCTTAAAARVPRAHALQREEPLQ